MSQASLLVGGLKRALRAKGYTYRSLADHLELSEASIKYMFSKEKISLARLEQICHFLGMQISDLIHAMEADYQKTDLLTLEQEQELTQDLKLLLVAFLSINGCTFEEIIRHYNISETEAVRYLAHLDRLKILELLPGNRFKLFVSAKFSWRPDGPIQQFFTSRLQSDFLNHPFNQKDSTHYFLTALLSPESAGRLGEKIRGLVSDFREYNQEELHLSIDEREVTSLLVAARSWKPQVFDDMRKDQSDCCEV